MIDARGILFDLDGVLYNSDRLIPGAPEAVQWVKSERIPHLFVTNTTSRSRAVLVEKLRGFGIPADENDMMTPAVAAASALRAKCDGPIALFLRPSTRGEFDGLPVLPNDAERGAEYVVIGDLGHHWDYATLNRAFRLLHHNPDAKLIALGMTRYWLAADGISLDVAPFVAALEHATGRSPEVFGKPAAAFFDAAVRKLGLRAEEAVMIGDDIVADIGGAMQAGLRGALVKTGKYRDADLAGDVKPDAVLGSVAELPRWWRA